MRRITDIKELKEGTKIVRVYNGRIDYFSFLMVHPCNEKYVLLMDDLTKDATKFYIPNLLDKHGYFYIDYSRRELLEKEIEEHQKAIDALRRRIACLKD